MTRNIVTWGKKTRDRARAEKRPMICLAYDLSTTGAADGESIQYVGVGDDELIREIRKLIVSRTGLSR